MSDRNWRPSQTTGQLNRRSWYILIFVSCWWTIWWTIWIIWSGRLQQADEQPLTWRCSEVRALKIGQIGQFQSFWSRLIKNQQLSSYSHPKRRQDLQWIWMIWDPMLLILHLPARYASRMSRSWHQKPRASIRSWMSHVTPSAARSCH